MRTRVPVVVGDEGVIAWLPLPGKRMSMVWSAPTRWRASSSRGPRRTRAARRGSRQVDPGCAGGDHAGCGVSMAFLKLDSVIASRFALIAMRARRASSPGKAQPRLRRRIGAVEAARRPRPGHRCRRAVAAASVRVAPLRAGAGDAGGDRRAGATVRFARAVGALDAEPRNARCRRHRSTQAPSVGSRATLSRASPVAPAFRACNS